MLSEKYVEEQVAHVLDRRPISIFQSIPSPLKPYEIQKQRNDEVENAGLLVIYSPQSPAIRAACAACACRSPLKKLPPSPSSPQKYRLAGCGRDLERDDDACATDVAQFMVESFLLAGSLPSEDHNQLKTTVDIP